MGITSRAKIKEGAKSYFSNIYSNPLISRPTMGNAGFMKLSENQATWLERDVTIEEVHLAIFSSEGSKAQALTISTSSFIRSFGS